MLKTKKVALLFNIYAKHDCNSSTFVYSLYINNETNQGHQMHKRLKISEELHAEIKKEAKDKGMFIDEFLRLLMDQHKGMKFLMDQHNKRK